MAESIRVQKISRLLQKTLAAIFLQEKATLLGSMIVTVTEVGISPDLGIAKVYLSFLRNEDQAGGIAKIEAKKGAIKRFLGAHVKSKLRRVPDLRFYNDESVAHAAKMHRLLDGL